MFSFGVEALKSCQLKNSASTSEAMDGEKHLTVRSVLVGLLVGFLMCCSNMYFGLQSGWVTMGSLQSAVLGFGAFKALQRCGLGQGFSVGENVIIQTTSVATATMPLAAGFVSIIPALGMLTTDENPSGPVTLSYLEMILWSLALAFFGVFAAIPLRDQVILRERLRFPSGAATAKVIQILHKNETRAYFPLEEEDEEVRQISEESGGNVGDMEKSRQPTSLESQEEQPTSDELPPPHKEDREELGIPGDWWLSCKTILISFGVSFVYKIIAEWTLVGCNKKPEGGKTCKAILKDFPIFTWMGLGAVTQWGWSIAPLLGYVGQGMIMGPRTCVSMLGGALTGFAILGPIAKRKGWAPGDIDSVKDGATGWVLWVSIAIMLGDSLTSLLILTTNAIMQKIKAMHGKVVLEADSEPLEHKIPPLMWLGGLGGSTVICTAILSWLFSMPIYQPIVAVAAAALVAILAVRALGETDLNPVSGVGKLSQILFAGIAPNKVVANIVAGAVAEAGAQQAGDIMQDFKTAHLLGVPPRPQFIGQLIGSLASVFFSVGAFALFSHAWEIPGDELKVPTAEIWIDMAQLLNGGSLPQGILPFAIVGAFLAAGTVLVLHLMSLRGVSKSVMQWVPSGIGFAVGMYVGPKFTIPRVIGSLAEQIWLWVSPGTHSTLMVVVASGLVLGEGTGALIVAFIKAFVNAQTTAT